MFEICSDLSKIGIKIYYFCQFSKRPKNGQMAKPFYFWQTVSKRAKFGRFGLSKGQKATLFQMTHFLLSFFRDSVFRKEQKTYLFMDHFRLS